MKISLQSLDVIHLKQIDTATVLIPMIEEKSSWNSL